MILFYLNCGVLAVGGVLLAVNAIMLRRIVRLDNILTRLITATFNQQLMRLPIWKAWVDTMGEIEVNVRAGRYHWNLKP